MATNTQAALKVQARWDLTTGALDLVLRMGGRATRRRRRPAPPGRCCCATSAMSAWVACAPWRGGRADPRLPAQPLVRARRAAWAAAAFLAAQGAAVVDCPILLSGASACPAASSRGAVSPAVAARRREAWQKEAQREGVAVARGWALAEWTR
ncbi:MAG: hypothetical protein U0232_08410 [Thermomicrobiales bacterium]